MLGDKISVRILSASLQFFVFLLLKFLFNSREAIAGANISLHLVLFLSRRQDFCYDYMTSQSPEILFVRSWNSIWNARLTSFFALNGVFRLFICVIIFVFTRDLLNSKNWLPQLSFDSNNEILLCCLFYNEGMFLFNVKFPPTNDIIHAIVFVIVWTIFGRIACFVHKLKVF